MARPAYMAPMRVVLRVVANVAVAIIYVAVTVAVSSFVSDVSNVSAGDIWRCPGLSTPLSPRVTRLSTMTNVIRLVACSYLRTMRDGTSRCGGDDEMSTDTDPSNADHSHTNGKPRNLHHYTHSTAETDEHYSAE